MNASPSTPQNIGPPDVVDRGSTTLIMSNVVGPRREMHGLAELIAISLPILEFLAHLFNDTIDVVLRALLREVRLSIES